MAILYLLLLRSSDLVASGTVFSALMTFYDDPTKKKSSSCEALGSQSLKLDLVSSLVSK